MRFIPESYYLLLQYRIFFSVNENRTVKQNNQSDFKALLNYPITLQENEDKKAIVWQIWLLIARFQNGSNKVAIESRVVQFWSEIIRVISESNERAARV